MRKKEFLRQLSKKLDHMSRADREDVLAYYDELIEDKLERTDEDEEDIIYGLGSIDRIARKVSRIANESNTKIKVDDDEEELGYTKGNRKRKRKANGFMAFISTILAIILVPVFIVLGIVVAAVIISVFVASISIVIAGVYVGGTGIAVAFSSLTLGLFQTGIGIIVIGIGIIIFPLITKLVTFAFKLLITVSKKICRGIKYIGGSSYEN